MADKISFVVDFAELANYTPVEGIGTSGLLKLDGFYSLTIHKVTLGRSKEAGNPKFILSTTVNDTDEKGQTIVAEVLAGGKDKNGNPLARQLGDLFHSMGLTMEQVRAMANNGQQQGEAVANMLTGKTVHALIEAETYNGNTTSRVRNFVGKTKYDDAVAANAHRKPRKADTQYATMPATGTQTTTAAAPTISGLTIPTAAPTNGAMPDPMAKLGSLGLRV